MTSVLGIDTSFLADTSVGLYFSDKERLELNLSQPLSQEQKLFAALDTLLASLSREINEIDLIAVGLGPGSFTGLRIGISAARALSYALKKPIIGLSSLELLVSSVFPAGIDADTLAVPVLDARMKRVFTALYGRTGRLTPDLDITPEALAEQMLQHKYRESVVMGDGTDMVKDALTKALGTRVRFMPAARISGQAVCSLALEKLKTSPPLDLVHAEPVYLRKSEAEAMRDARLSNS